MATKRKCLTVEEKMKVIKYSDDHHVCSQASIARHLGLAQPTVSSILKKRDHISSLAAKGLTNVRKDRSSNCELLEQGLESFFDSCRAKSLKTITYDMMIVKGRAIADGLVERGLVERKDLPSTDSAWHSYMERFVRKRSIKSRRCYGESGDADDEAAKRFIDDVWPELFASVDRDASRVFNMDETGLFWRALPKRTLAVADEKLKGSKTQKDRVTFATTTCMDGSKLPLHGIGTARLPRAVAAAHTTPAQVLGGRWTANTKGWMNSGVFTQWLLELNQQFRRTRGKPVILLVDNCSAHKVTDVEDRLDFIKVVFLPPNTTSLIQPCDAGIIKSFKSTYRRSMLRKIGQLVDDPSIEKLSTAGLKKNINMLHCLQFAKGAWDAVETSTIVNCWRHAGFYTDDAQVDPELPGAEAEDDNDDLQELADLDVDAPCTSQAPDSTDDIVDMLAANVEANHGDDNGDDDDDDDLPGSAPQQPTTQDIFNALDVLRSALYAVKAGDKQHREISDIETFLSTRAASRSQQTTLDSFFR